MTREDSSASSSMPFAAHKLTDNLCDLGHFFLLSRHQRAIDVMSTVDCTKPALETDDFKKHNNYCSR